MVLCDFFVYFGYAMNNFHKLIIKTKYFFGLSKNVPYIFFIGFNKSGTTSIHKLFSENGIPSIHWKGGKLARCCLINAIKGKPLLAGYDRAFRVFSDIAFRTDKFWFEGNSFFRQLDKDYPNSFFIYNKRDVDDWINSRVNHRGRVGGVSLLELHKNILNTKENSDVINHWRKVRQRFEDDIRDYFRGSKKFIEIDISDPAFVEVLSEFIGVHLDPVHWGQYNVNPNIYR